MVQVALLNLDPAIPEAQSTPFDLRSHPRLSFFVKPLLSLGTKCPNQLKVIILILAGSCRIQQS